ncbi:MAG TPA: UDP-N-acetylglucosamine 2-epimerase (non-hydrolyzing) [Clostridiales bacterium]|nr:UDP-N-acetylglucosamine 2-epimerase (non-hydrolyzing) [Clostridiales bacterium]
MEKLKVMTVVGTRPEIIRLSCIINRLEAAQTIDHVLVHTGQNYDYELNQVFFHDLNIKKPDYYLDAAGKTAVETIGRILMNLDPVLEQEQPDALLILGDTNSCLCAIAAKKRRIPIFHMEAGNRCFDHRVPEETNRRLVDHLADINLPYSSIAREYLLREGIPADRIIKTGSPMYEVIQSRRKEIGQSDVLERLGLGSGEYYIVSFHREENINSEEHFKKIVDTINAIADTYQKPVIISTHPRTRLMLENRGMEFHPLVTAMKPFGFFDYCKLQMEAKAVLSDSGTVSEEAAILGLRAINLREAHERMEAMEEAIVMMTGAGKDRVLQALSLLEEQEEGTLRGVSDYGMPNVSEKVVRIILSYTDYVNRVVWNKV